MQNLGICIKRCCSTLVRLTAAAGAGRGRVDGVSGPDNVFASDSDSGHGHGHGLGLGLGLCPVSGTGQLGLHYTTLH